MNRRRGTTLIEVIVALTAGSVILGVAAAMLCLLLRTQSVSRDHVHQGTVLSRLSEQFRHDVLAATAVDGREANSWEFTMTPERTVSYRAESETLVREETADGEPTRQQRFSLPPGTAPSIESEGSPSATIVSLIVAPAADDRQRPAARIARFDARLGGDHRFRGPRQPPQAPAEPSSEDPND